MRGDNDFMHSLRDKARNRNWLKHVSMVEANLTVNEKMTAVVNYQGIDGSSDNSVLAF